MLSNISLSFISFINLFMIPLIGLRIYCNRHSIRWGFHSETVYFYVLMTILNIPVTYIVVNLIEEITSTVIYVETTKYMVIALLSCVSLPFLMDAIKNHISIDVKISLRQKEKSDEK